MYIIEIIYINENIKHKANKAFLIRRNTVY